MLFWILLALVLLLLGGAFAFGWVMSNRFLVPQPYSLMPEFEIGDVEPGEDGSRLVTLPVSSEPGQFADVAKEGIYNLLWEGGYGRLGPIEADFGDQLVRSLSEVTGEPPKAGEPARLDVAIFRRDPLQDHGIPFEELVLEGDAGDLHAWWIEAPTSRAVLTLHGRRRADRTETLRVLPVLVDEGWSVLALAYRNHDVSDPSPDGLFHYGASEVEDALVGVAELHRRGVEEVVLYGFSMGGAVALEAARRWPDTAPELAGLILDSPLLDPRTVIRKGARDADLPLPDVAADVALAVGRLRTGVNWDSLDQRRSAGRIGVPLLLFAGTADETIPIELVDEFAARVEAPLDYRRLEGVEHVEAWNRGREQYEEAVRRFLEAAAAGEPEMMASSRERDRTAGPSE